MEKLSLQFIDYHSAIISNGKNSLEIQLFSPADLSRLQLVYDRLAAEKRRAHAKKHKTR